MKNRERKAFTLVEVILAILIISAIITVLLYFYQRSVEVRQTILGEAEFLSVNRMLMDQMTAELRSARVVEDQMIGFEGSSNAISFVCTILPQSPRWLLNTNEIAVSSPATDLRRVTYRLLAGTNVTQILGVDRSEGFLAGQTFTVGTNATEFSRTNSTTETADSASTTNEVENVRKPLTLLVKHLQFRYWAGTNWLDSWSGLELPGGVEVTLGRDAADPIAQASETNSVEVFRRVVFLPNSVPAANKVVIEEPVPAF